MSGRVIATKEDWEDAVNVYIDGVCVGYVRPSDQQWARGWRPVTMDDRELGDEPTQRDAVQALVGFEDRRENRRER